MEIFLKPKNTKDCTVLLYLQKLCTFDKIDAMITKTKLKETLERFPEEFSIDDLIDKLIIIDKIERGNQQSLNGDVISESDLDKEIEAWFE